MKRIFSLITPRVYFLLFTLFSGIIFTLSIQINRTVRGDFLIHMFDIPGEAILLRLPYGHNVLVDGGMNVKVTEKINAYIPFWERKIDAIILSHADKDHLEGILSVMKYFSIDAIFVSGVHHESHLYGLFIQETKRQNIPMIFTTSHTDFRFGDAVFDALYPASSVLGKKLKGNTYSLVFRGTYNGKSILLTGDIEKKSEKNILETPVKIQSDILKIAHHGSKTSSTPAFIQAVSPKKAIISAHRTNPFGHPHNSVTDHFASFAIPTLTTKNIGDISFSLLSL
jgi:competence protein ComEC